MLGVLAFVLARGGRSDEAAATLAAAVALHERKGNLAGAQQARALVAAATLPRPA
jgi:hypothetical protein